MSEELGHKAIISKETKISQWFWLTPFCMVGVLLYLKILSNPYLQCTEDSYRYFELATKLINGQNPLLDLKNISGKTFTPFPPFYSGLIAILSFGGRFSWLWCSKVANLLCIGMLMGMVSKFLRPALPVFCLLFFSDTSAFLFSHSWSEGWAFGIVCLFIISVTKAKNLVPWISPLLLLVRYSNWVIVPVNLLQIRNGNGLRILQSTWISIGSLIAFLSWEALTSGYFTGGDRPSQVSNMFPNAYSKLLIDEISWIKDFQLAFEYKLGLAIIELILFWAFVRFLRIKWVKSSALSNHLFLYGCFYIIGSVLTHSFFSFAEPLDERLLGPGVLAIFGGSAFMTNGAMAPKWKWNVTYGLLFLLQLPWKYLIGIW